MVDRLVEKLIRKSPHLTAEQARRRVDTWLLQVGQAAGYQSATVHAAMESAVVCHKTLRLTSSLVT